MYVFKGEFEETVSTIKADIETALRFAKESGKPLLLIAMEDGSDLSTLLVPALLKSAHDSGIRQFAFEGSPEVIDIIENAPLSDRWDPWFYSLPMASKGLSMNIVGVDKPNKIVSLWNSSTYEEKVEAIKAGMVGEGLLQRQAHITQELLKLNENTLFITDITHLEPIARNPDLRGKFHICAASIASPERGMAAGSSVHYSSLREIFDHIERDSGERLEQSDQEILNQYRLSDATCESIMDAGVGEDNLLNPLFRFLLGPDRFAVFNKALNPSQSPKPKGLDFGMP